MVDHAEFLRLQTDSTRLALCANPFRPLRVSRRTIPSYPIEWLVEWWHKGALQLWLVRRSVDLAHIRVERQVLDLLFREVFRIVGFKGHAIVTHAFRPMCTHLRVTVTRDLAVLFVQPVIERGLLDNLPGILDCGLRTESDGLILCERHTIQALLAIRSVPLLLLSCLLPVPKKQLIAMPLSQAKIPHQYINFFLSSSSSSSNSLEPNIPNRNTI